MTDPSTLIIRAGLAEDAGEVWRVHVASIRGLCAGAYTAEQIEAWAGPKTPERTGRQLALGRSLVAVQRGRIAGFVDWGERDGCGEVMALYIDPDASARGVGRALFDGALALLRERGFTRVLVDSTVNAEGFYSRMGMARTGLGSRMINNATMMPCVHMHMDLSPTGPAPKPSRSDPTLTSSPAPLAAPGHPAALQAPWRLEYLEALSEKERAEGGPGAEGLGGSGGAGSFLRAYWLDSSPEADRRHHVIVRTADSAEMVGGLIMLNAFPYAGGHLLAALGDPRPTLLDYTAAQRAALWRLTDCAAAVLRATLDPQGINFGINQGRAAGAGVPGHLHVHLVPRWGGDVNFMTAVGNIRVIPSSLEVMAVRMREAWGKVRGEWA